MRDESVDASNHQCLRLLTKLGLDGLMILGRLAVACKSHWSEMAKTRSLQVPRMVVGRHPHLSVRQAIPSVPSMYCRSHFSLRMSTLKSGARARMMGSCS